ncbi:MAG: hydrogenobyrinic acid a,c-diamide synthase (glutamine-hydrolyzing) [Chlorobium sp.]|nr:MAG: hydrogenobyrinic acid a,c-diamide synthase (glutamine-hydrolyzing) [Chlorobium sp.]
MVSAAWKSSGKTMVSLGILRYLVRQGVAVSSFKKGPDYIDPSWHKLASGSECYNLDPYLMGSDACLDSFHRNISEDGTTFALVEGNHGLHDGLSLDGSDSSAGLALMLDMPVLVVVDSRKTSRGVAALVLGMQQMSPRACIRGVILNQVKSSRQGEKQKQAIEHYCKVPVLGMIPFDSDLVIPERHLGLTTVGETVDANLYIERAAEALDRYCDMKALLALFYEAPPMEMRENAGFVKSIQVRAKIGVFRDAAFCFYYPDNLRALRENGAELVFINSFTSHALPDVDALYLGGGFPESFFEILSSNNGLLKDVREHAEAGMPVYAECGGFIYLCRNATWGGRTYPLAGILPFEIGFGHIPAGHGYLDLKSSRDSPWFRKDERVKAHEFHYSRVLAPAGETLFQFEVIRGAGITGKRDGALHQNLFASFAHLHVSGNPGWAERFVQLAFEFKTGYRFLV